MAKNIIEVKNLQKKFSGSQVLKNINLNIKKGEILGILGANGAGKTTILRILTGLLKADQGSINIMGENIIQKFPAWIKEKMGVVFEESNLYSRLNAFDNLKLFAAINNIAETKVEKLLLEYQLKSAAKKEVRYFSKGMKKRLMICRALISEPEILILDEATGGLDIISAEIIRNKVLKLKEKGKTVILSTHYLEEADRLCDRIAFLNKGELMALGKPESFKANFKQKSLEMKFLLAEQNEVEVKNFLKEKEIAVDFYQIEAGILTIRLIIDQQIFQKAAKIAEKFKIIEINKLEANLQQVFRELNNL